jgi:predicted methyltransferase
MTTHHCDKSHSASALRPFARYSCGLALGLALAVVSSGNALASAAGATAATGAIAAAIADPARPVTDIARDANRKPAAMLEFAGIKEGDKVADYAVGQGYFTRLFSAIVGPRGHVYGSVPNTLYKYPNIVKGTAEVEAYLFTHPNASLNFGGALDVARYPEHLDVFWISQNYHDLKDKFMGPVDTAAFNRAVFAALKPGAVYILIDHVAAAGAPADVTETLHRIEPAVVRREVEAAGFKFVGESRLLANPSDPHTAGVFDPSIVGQTDQFIFKFTRP